MIENACRGYIGDKHGPFRELSYLLFNKQSPDYFDIAHSLIILAKGYGLEKLANKVESEVFKKELQEKNRYLFRL